jgi:hypothetical protein
VSARTLPIALLAVGLGLGLCCRREAPPRASPAPAPRPAPPAPAAFTHPLLAGASTETVREDCSNRGLATVLERQRAAAGQPPAQASPAGPHPRKSSLPDCGDFQVRESLLPRVAACVGRDGPFDVEWAVAQSATLSLGICLDCGQGRRERAARCERARELASRIDSALRNRGPAP